LEGYNECSKLNRKKRALVSGLGDVEVIMRGKYVHVGSSKSSFLQGEKIAKPQLYTF
jgi:hypothetical protein